MKARRILGAATSVALALGIGVGVATACEGDTADVRSSGSSQPFVAVGGLQLTPQSVYAAQGTRLYAGGGVRSSFDGDTPISEPSQSMAVYDQLTGEWSALPDTPKSMWVIGAAAQDRTLFLAAQRCGHEEDMIDTDLVERCDTLAVLRLEKGNTAWSEVEVPADMEANGHYSLREFGTDRLVFVPDSLGLKPMLVYTASNGSWKQIGSPETSPERGVDIACSSGDTFLADSFLGFSAPGISESTVTLIPLRSDLSWGEPFTYDLGPTSSDLSRPDTHRLCGSSALIDPHRDLKSASVITTGAAGVEHRVVDIAGPISTGASSLYRSVGSLHSLLVRPSGSSAAGLVTSDAALSPSDSIIGSAESSDGVFAVVSSEDGAIDVKFLRKD